ncbi:MAG: nucleotide excision repair endonuclease, partial [Sedimenticolaceae bacterium]
MAIHGLDEEGDRHRAMTDTALLPQLVQCCVNEHGVDQVEAAFSAQTQRTSLPSQLDESLLNEMPKSPGVYLFYGDKNSLLYVGKSVDIRSRVMSHFSDAKRNDKEQRLSQAVRDIQWQSTSGELSALLLESRMVKELSPSYNRRLRLPKSIIT